MRLNNVDLNLFVVFATVYEERSLTRAANHLCITQPAVSNALARLRTVFDDPLFTRTSRGMEPTPFAQSILPQVRQALQLLESSIDKGQIFRPEEVSATFRIVMHDWLEALLLPRLLANIREQAPNIQITSYTAEKKEIHQGLSSGSIVLAVGGPLLKDSSLTWELLFRDDYVCTMRENHPLLDAPLTLENYLSAEHIHVSSRKFGGGQVDATLKEMGQKRKIALRSQHYLVAPKLVEKSDMVLTMPSLLTRLYNLPQRELPFPSPELEMYMYWHKSVDSSPQIKWLREQMKATI